MGLLDCKIGNAEANIREIKRKRENNEMETLRKHLEIIHRKHAQAPLKGL